jgi:hypothetical protein
VRSPKSIARRLAVIGGAAFVLGGSLVGAAVVAGAATPTITLHYVPPGGFPNTGTIPPILISGKGFPPKSTLWIVQCSVTTSGPAEPTMSVPVNSTVTFTLPVGCSAPSEVPAKTSASGNLGQTGFTVLRGTVGPPDTGNDSAGVSGATDAANYPCPPFVDQASTNACQIEVLEASGTFASAPVTFVTNSTPNTTIPATTTTAPCNVQNGVATSPGTTGASGTGVATVTQTGGSAPPAGTVTQAATCVLGGETVQVAASGLSVGNGGLATVIECNSAAGQPTIPYAGHAIPVSCTAITKTTLINLTSNSLPAQSFTIVQGVTGPPAVGTDSAGHSATTDAANYPCPPTAAQVAAGATCAIAVGTAYLSGTPTNTDQLPVPISFNEAKLAAGTTSNNAAKAAAAAAAAAKTVATKASSSSLAFTGAGPGLRWLGLLGVLLMILGAAVLVVVEGPRRFLRFAVIHGRRGRTEETS